MVLPVEKLHVFTKHLTHITAETTHTDELLPIRSCFSPSLRKCMVRRNSLGLEMAGALKDTKL